MDKEETKKADKSTKSTTKKKPPVKTAGKKDKKKSQASKTKAVKSKSTKSVKAPTQKSSATKPKKTAVKKATAPKKTAKSPSVKPKPATKAKKTDIKPVTKSIRQPASPISTQTDSVSTQADAKTSLPPPVLETRSVDAKPSQAEGGSRIGFYMALGFGILILLILFASSRNMDRYYLTAKDGALIIWKGKFSPQGRNRLVIMPGVRPPNDIKDVYRKEEVYPLAFNFYIEKADALMEVPGMLDFVGIKSYLHRAMDFATTDQERLTAKDRIKHIELTILLYKADVAASKGTSAGLKSATNYLNQASIMEPDDIEAALIQQKMESIQSVMRSLESKSERNVEVTPQSTKPKPAETPPHGKTTNAEG